MTEARVRLVVPAPLVSAYPGAVQRHLQTLEIFMGDIRLLKLKGPVWFNCGFERE
jgi:hypothetical protein